jgi:type III pantothenate kinase
MEIFLFKDKMKKILAIDVGNTTIEACIITNKEEITEKKFVSSKIDIEINLPIFFDFFKSFKIDCVIVSSVVPSLNNYILDYFQRLDCKILFISDKLNNIVKTKSHSIGADILCKSVYVANNYKGKTLIVDVGTATVLNYIEDKELKSASISVGLNTMYQSLSQNTELLPTLTPKVVESVLGKDAQSCMHGGIFLGYIGLLNYIVSKALKEVSATRVILTGGYSELISNKLTFDFILDKHLIFKGIYLIYENNS